MVSRNLGKLAKAHSGNIDNEELGRKIEEYLSNPAEETVYLGSHLMAMKEYGALADFTAAYESTPEIEYGMGRVNIRNGRVTAIYAHGRGLEEIPESIKEFGMLERLNLSDNKMTSIPKCLRKCRDLRSVYLSNNEIDSIPYVIGDMKSLEMFHVDGNNIGSISGRIGELNLVTFHASGNMLDRIPDRLAKIKTLRWLFLDDNQIAELPKHIENLRLETLCLRKNPLEEGEKARLKKAFGSKVWI